MKVREAQVAGSFYPSSKKLLLNFLQSEVKLPKEKEQALAILMPHAGYVYSGKTAALTISQVKITDSVLLIGPNHTGLGSPFSLMREGIWETPLGNVEIDTKLADGLLAHSSLLTEDESAHRHEHSLEVELPFLKFLKEEVKIVPLTVAQEDLGEVRQAAQEIAKTLVDYGQKVLIVASSDMTHYESDASAHRKDHLAIEAMEALDEEKLAKVVRQHRISMCGFIPAYMTLILTKLLGAKKATLVDYRTSAEASGDYERVVGYAGLVIC